MNRRHLRFLTEILYVPERFFTVPATPNSSIARAARRMWLCGTCSTFWERSDAASFLAACRRRDPRPLLSTSVARPGLQASSRLPSGIGHSILPVLPAAMRFALLCDLDSAISALRVFNTLPWTTLPTRRKLIGVFIEFDLPRALRAAVGPFSGLFAYVVRHMTLLPNRRPQPHSAARPTLRVATDSARTSQYASDDPISIARPSKDRPGGD